MYNQDGYFPYYGIILNEADINHNRLQHDSYQIYVNNDYIADKVLISQNEKINEVDDYLKEQGLYEFSSELDGNKYNLICDDKEVSKRLKKILNIYLNIR